MKSVDRRDLGSGPNQASGDHYQLDVVSPEQLLTLLEARELGLRRRFEQVIGELEETRDMLVRIRVEGPEQTASRRSTPPTKPRRRKPQTKARAARRTIRATRPSNGCKRIWSLRLLRARQSLLQSQKSAQEVLGIAASFRDIYEELINNRVDTEDRKTRLKEHIAAPLQSIAETQLAELGPQIGEAGRRHCRCGDQRSSGGRGPDDRGSRPSRYRSVEPNPAWISQPSYNGCWTWNRSTNCSTLYAV